MNEVLDEEPTGDLAALESARDDARACMMELQARLDRLLETLRDGVASDVPALEVDVQVAMQLQAELERRLSLVQLASAGLSSVESAWDARAGLALLCATLDKARTAAEQLRSGGPTEAEAAQASAELQQLQSTWADVYSLEALVADMVELGNGMAQLSPLVPGKLRAPLVDIESTTRNWLPIIGSVAAAAVVVPVAGVAGVGLVGVGALAAAAGAFALDQWQQRRSL